MKDYYINNKVVKDNLLSNMLQELNSISRMAVIENASVTEKMISIYSNLLKYCWFETGQKVTAAKEMNMVLKQFELFKLKNASLLDYEYEAKGDLTMVFIPHCTISLCIKQILSIMEQMGRSFYVQIEVEERREEIAVNFSFEGQVDFEAVAYKLGHCQQDYETFNEAVQTWRESFGETSFQIKIDSISTQRLALRFSCR